MNFFFESLLTIASLTNNCAGVQLATRLFVPLRKVPRARCSSSHDEMRVFRSIPDSERRLFQVAIRNDWVCSKASRRADMYTWALDLFGELRLECYNNLANENLPIFLRGHAVSTAVSRGEIADVPRRMYGHRFLIFC